MASNRKRSNKKVSSFRLTLDERDQIHPLTLIIILSISAGAVLALVTNK